MNCSESRSPPSRASRASSAIWSETRFSWSSAIRTGSARPLNAVLGAPMPGTLTSASASSRYWTIIIAWLRSSTAWA